MTVFLSCAAAWVFSSVFPDAGHALNVPMKLHLRDSQGASKKDSRYYRQEMTNYVDLQYWGNLDIGNQVVQGLLDTGSYELLVCSEAAKGCGKAAVYKHSDSTEVVGFRGLHVYGSGWAASQIVTDTVAITGAPSSAGLVQEEQYFWEILRTYMPVIASGNFQAIVGLGPPEIPDQDARMNANAAKLHNGVENTYASQQAARNLSAKADYLENHSTLLESWDVRVFSVCLLRPYEAPGYLMWNDEDTQDAYASLFRFVEVTAERYWGARLTQAHVGDTDLGCATGCGAIVDSGTSLILVDPDSWQTMHDFLVNEQAAGNLAPDCSNLDELPDLEFQMSGVDFRLPPQSYVGEVSGDVPPGLEPFFPNSEYSACELLLSPIESSTQGGPLWIVGMPFFREYYTMFDLGRNPRSRRSRGMYTAPVGEECNPVNIDDEANARPTVQSQRRTVRNVERSKVRIPEWAVLASRAGSIKI